MAFVTPISTPLAASRFAPPLAATSARRAPVRAPSIAMDAAPATPPPASRTSPPSPDAYDPESFMRPELLAMSPYTPILPYDVLAESLGRAPEDIVKLDANENPYGPSPTVLPSLSSAEYLHIYPDPESTALRAALSDHVNVPVDHLIVGAGADELIDLLCRLFITPGDSILNTPPTFGMYKFDADLSAASIIDVPRLADFSIDIDAVEQVFRTHAHPPKLLFVASPNNPDGSILSDDHLRRLLALPTLVVLDEAYAEFANRQRITWVPSFPNLVVLRTFSKWAGLAGMRVGYGAFPLSVIKHLWKIKQPYNISVAAQIAATAALNDQNYLMTIVAKLVEARNHFYHAIKPFDWLTAYPSNSNFVLCRVGNGREAKQIKTELADRGILIRYYTTPGLTDCIRISMGTPEQMQRLYHALAEL